MPKEIVKEYKLKRSDDKLEKNTASEHIVLLNNQIEFENDSEKKKVVKAILDEFCAIKAERKDAGVDSYFDRMEGLEKSETEMFNTLFNLSVPTARTISDEIVRTLLNAFFNIDPIFTVSARPEFGSDQNAEEITKKIEEFLDYKLDPNITADVNLYDACTPCFKHACVYGLGLLRVSYRPYVEKRVRKVTYDGSNQEVVLDDRTGDVVLDDTGQPIIINNGIKMFSQDFETAPEKGSDNYGEYESILKELSLGRRVTVRVEEDVIVNNDPYFEAVHPRDFYVRINTKGYHGLKRALLTVERREYTYFELKEEERAKRFYDIDKIFHVPNNKDELRVGYENEIVEIFECVYYYDKNRDGNPIKTVIWIYEPNSLIIGACSYPFENLDCYYVPFTVFKDELCFYQRSAIEDIYESSRAKNILLNIFTETLYSHLKDIPIVPEGHSFIEEYINHGGLRPGKPLILEEGEEVPIRWNDTQTNPNLSLTFPILNYIESYENKVTSVNQVRQSAESLDPESSGKKFIAQQQIADQNISGYIKTISKCFNLIPNLILAIYDQISEDGQKFAKKLNNQMKKVVGANVFNTLSNDEMRSQVNVYSEAHSRHIERLQEQRVAQLLTQTLLQIPVIGQRVESQVALARKLIETQGTGWRQYADYIVPTVEQMQQEKVVAIVTAMEQYRKTIEQLAIKSGQQPNTLFNPQEFLAFVEQALREQAGVAK